MDTRRIFQRGIVVLLVATLVSSSFVGVAAAETRTGGTVVIEEGETVDGLTAFAGTVIVRGTVDGSLEGAAGSIVIEPTGTVTGDLSAAAGNFRIAGTVQGNVDVGGGSVALAEGGRVGGNLKVGAGFVLIAGEVGGNAVLGASSVRLAETGAVGGNLRYDTDATFTNDGGTVGGSIRAEPDLGGGDFGLPDVGSVVFTAYFIMVNLVLGAILLVAMPGFSQRINETVAAEPLKSGGVGFLALVGVPIALVVLAITIVGIPLTLAGAFAFALLAWVALIYGRIAVAAWLLDRLDVTNRWVALVVGIVGFGILGQVPVLGGLLTFVTFLLGLGSVALVLYDRRRGEKETPEEAEPAGTEGGEAGAV